MVIASGVGVNNRVQRKDLSLNPVIDSDPGLAAAPGFGDQYGVKHYIQAAQGI